MITTGDGKFYSNGLDLAFLSECSPEEAMKNLNDFPSLMLRMLTFPVPTIAALNGKHFMYCISLNKHPRSNKRPSPNIKRPSIP